MRRAHALIASHGRRVAAATATALLLVSGTLAMSQVGAGATQPVDNGPDTNAKNPTCAFLGYDHGFKIEGVPDNTTYDIVDTENDDDTVVGVLTITDGDDFGFHWSSPDQPFDAVIVKASDDANVTHYDPPATSDDAVSVPLEDHEGYHEISHVSFCWDEETPPPDTKDVTVTKKWFDANGEPTTAPDPDDITIGIKVTATGADDQTLDADDLGSEWTTDVEVPADADDAAATETTEPDGWHEIDCPTPDVEVSTVEEDNQELVICNQQDDEEQTNDGITVEKLWFDREGDPRDAPASSNIVVTVDLEEGSDVLLDHDDLTDADGIAEVDVDSKNIDDVTETTVPAGWHEIDCPRDSEPTVETSIDTADFTICNQQNDGDGDCDGEGDGDGDGGGGGGGGGATDVCTNQPGAQDAVPVGWTTDGQGNCTPPSGEALGEQIELPFTPDVEPPAEVLPEVIVAPPATSSEPAGPTLAFTGSDTRSLLSAAFGLLGLGGIFVAVGRKRRRVTS
jgi:hypothetical protein